MLSLGFLLIAFGVPAASLPSGVITHPSPSARPSSSTHLSSSTHPSSETHPSSSPNPSSSSAPPTLTLKINNTVPVGAKGPISPSWLGFGIEGGSFPAYAGTPAKPNKFSQNLVDTLSNRTGAPVILRVGGTSLDHSILLHNQSEPAVELGTKPKAISINPFFFELFKLFPNSKYTLNVPFAAANLSYALQFANQSLTHIGNRLNAIEIGNEPDLYLGHDRPKNYTMNDYVKQWKQFASAMDKQLKLPAGPIYEGLSLATGVTKHTPNFNVQEAFKDGYFDNTRIKSISQHYYEATSDADISKSLLNHSFTASQTNRFREPADFLAQKLPNVSFVLGEVGSSADGAKNKTDELPFAAGLGAAIWTMDWMLYAMSIGVDGVSMQLGNNFTFAAWIPEYASTFSTGPAVFAPYMAHVAVADFIGKNKGSLHVSSLQTNNSRVTAYVGYRDGKPAQVVVLNLQVFSGNGRRPTTIVEVPVAGQAKSVQVRRLTGAETGSISNVTWAGETWTHASNGRPVRQGKATEDTHVVNGKAKVAVGASEAVMVDLS